ncbi:DUF1472 domain-containing protein (plasmid) [Leclercia adecarboxylata]|nr:DUF1472 domain-containing protein [Leclercia adecarboxylata]
MYSAFYAAPARRISAPCLHFSPNASDARVRFAAILARSQIFTPDAVLPVVLPLRFRGRTVQNVLAFICAAACGVALASSARSRAVVSARRRRRRISIRRTS